MGKPAKPEIDVEQLLLEKMRVLFEKACEKMEGVHSFLLQPAAKAAAGRYKPLKAAAHVGALVLTSAAQSEGPPTFEEFVSELDTNDKVTNGIFEFLVKVSPTNSAGWTALTGAAGDCHAIAEHKERTPLRRPHREAGDGLEEEQVEESQPTPAGPAVWALARRRGHAVE